MRLRRRTPEPTPGPTPAARPRRISRPEVVQALVSLYAEPRYLEVGVCEAETFDQVGATRRVAVDPAFRFDHEAPERTAVPGTTYHPVTSDAYFAAAPREERFDVVYLDGLHTFEQTLRDLMNALDRLEPRGVVLVDDTRPPTALAAIADREEFFAERTRLGSTDKRWMGDVFRLVWFVDTFCPHLSYGTIADNHGQTVIWRRDRADVTQRSIGELAALDFAGLEADLGTLRLAPFAEIRAALCTDLGLTAPG